jgi:hypothetical protein
MKEIGSDTRACSIGDPNESYGDRIPRTTFELCRSGGYDDKSDPTWKLANLSVNDCAMVVTIVGLNHQDLTDLSDFLEEYAQRLRDF